VEETIRMRQWHEAELGRLQCRRDFVFAREWNGVFYRTKQIRPIFVDEPAEIIDSDARMPSARVRQLAPVVHLYPDSDRRQTFVRNINGVGVDYLCLL